MESLRKLPEPPSRQSFLAAARLVTNRDGKLSLDKVLAEIRAIHVGEFEIRALDAGAAQIGMPQIRARQICPRHVGAVQRRAAEIGARQIGFRQIGARQFDIVETAAAEIDGGRAEKLQVCAPAARKTQDVFLMRLDYGVQAGGVGHLVLHARES